jgi:hypothetical protein
MGENAYPCSSVLYETTPSGWGFCQTPGGCAPGGHTCSRVGVLQAGRGGTAAAGNAFFLADGIGFFFTAILTRGRP